MESVSWTFRQVFGEIEDAGSVESADTVSAVEFDATGQLLAAGDHAGRLVVFQKEEHSSEYRFYAETHSHLPEKDYLKSIDIEGTINAICWLQGERRHPELLATNDKTIKLLELREDSGELAGKDTGECVVKRVFREGHAYHINSLDSNCDMETFLSADELRINTWHLEDTTKAFNIIDIKPAAIERLSHVITGARFSKQQADLFLYAMSGGQINCVDLRCCSQRNHVSRAFSQKHTAGFIGDIFRAVSDACFVNRDSNIVSRDYATLSVWDMRMEKTPVARILLSDVFDNYADVLYENNLIFDRFKLAHSEHGERIATGVYGNVLKIYEELSAESGPWETSISVGRMCSLDSAPSAGRRLLFDRTKKEYVSGESTDIDGITGRIVTAALHPSQNIAAFACQANLYIYGSDK